MPNSKLEGAKNPRWGDKDKQSICLDCKFTHYERIGVDTEDGYLGFTAKPTDPEEHGRLIFERAKAGDYGTIGDYIPPSYEKE